MAHGNQIWQARGQLIQNDLTLAQVVPSFMCQFSALTKIVSEQIFAESFNVTLDSPPD
jgi:hypothetical protein